MSRHVESPYFPESTPRTVEGGIEERLAGDAWFVAQLLSGEMPPDVEQVFTDVGLDLFPCGAGHLSLDCSCPDWEVPCKHLAAVFYRGRWCRSPSAECHWRRHCALPSTH